MKKIIYLLILMSLFSFESKSSHIVGGEMNVSQIGPNQFIVRSRFVRYCAGLQAPTNKVFRVFDANTHSLYSSFTANRDSIIRFAGTAATTLSYCVEVHFYSDTITLPNNPNGYYFTYSTCCRNAGINNIMSQGSTWTSEIPNPALPGRNSSPVFKDTVYRTSFCIGVNVNLDFSCTDADGDSLVYSLINPYSNPGTGKKPYTLIPYKPLHSVSNILGPGALCTINSSTGIVSGRSTQLGIYTVAVKCEEYRNGVKIGEVVRDIEIPSINCAMLSTPEIDLSSQIKIYPNPSNGIFKIEKSNSIENMKIEVYDIYGKVILSQEMNNSLNTINLNSVSKGIYMVKVTSNGLQAVKRIVVN